MRWSSPSPKPKALPAVTADLETIANDVSHRSSAQADNEQRSPPLAPASLIAELESLDLALLRKRWRSLLRSPAPAGLSRPLLIRILAWRVQILATGDLDNAALSILKAADGSMSGAVASLGVSGSRLRPGTVLVREHAGILHRVAVLADGFAWNGNTFGSLSAVALAITGLKWNGPRFFGLDRAASKPPKCNQSDGKKRRRESATSGTPSASPTQSHAKEST